ncbi:HBL033Wp [Eremothecium sinecaudum]|uniref:non-specific serine/threonine protein kinase n=1 Tax=Eremothecium sinecaudum TaxID=45286 RepID=A0A120K0Z8_9SACH|nr:HBL033Wp [Eremothecium sinecaudum]AMD18869.1 HBL033Wp [Eremothecium sinecaudum]
MQVGRGKGPNQPEPSDRVVMSVSDATKRLSQISTTSTRNTNTGKRKSKDTVGPWKLGKTLGKGSSGRVRLAKNVESGKLAAIKIVSKKSVSRHQYVQTDSSLPYGIEREIIIMKLITHPNIMALYEVWENKSELYLVLEYVEGGELFDYLLSRGKLPEQEAVHYFKQIVKGVAYCHHFNICHRDLKPENLLLDKKTRTVKIADFGMAALQTSNKLLETSCGSPHYASPEIVMGQKYHGSPSDVWSCGIILFALLTGNLPFNDDNVKKLLLKVQSGKYQMPQNLSRDAKDLISKMLVVDPDSRILIDDILKHQLLTKYESQGKTRAKLRTSLQLSSRTPSIVTLNSKAEIDDTILSNLSTLWHGAPKEYLVKKLLKKGFTEEKLFYSLLRKYQEKGNSVQTTPSTNSGSSDVATRDYQSSEAPSISGPKNGQKSQLSVASFSRSKRTREGFVASTSRVFKHSTSKVGSNIPFTAVHTSSSYKSLNSSISRARLASQANNAKPQRPIKKTLQESALKRSLYSLSSISKRSLNLNEQLQSGFNTTIEPLPSISPKSAGDPYSAPSFGERDMNSGGINDTILSPIRIIQPTFNFAMDNEGESDIYSRYYSSVEYGEGNTSIYKESSCSEEISSTIITNTRSPVFSRPTKKEQVAERQYIPSLDPRRRAPQPPTGIEVLLKKYKPMSPATSRDSSKKPTGNGLYSCNTSFFKIEGGEMSSCDYSERMEAKKNSSIGTIPSALTDDGKLTTTNAVTSTPVPDPSILAQSSAIHNDYQSSSRQSFKRNSQFERQRCDTYGLLRLPSSLLKSTNTFHNLNTFISNYGNKAQDCVVDKVDYTNMTSTSYDKVSDKVSSKSGYNSFTNGEGSASNFSDLSFLADLPTFTHIAQAVSISPVTKNFRHTLQPEAVEPVVERPATDRSTSGTKHIPHRQLSEENDKAGTTNEGESLNIFEDAPADVGSLLTNCSGLEPQVHRKAVSIDTLNTSYLLAPASDMRNSLHVNSNEVSFPRETTEEMIHKFEISPEKHCSQKQPTIRNATRLSTNLPSSKSLKSMFKDLEEETANTNHKKQRDRSEPLAQDINDSPFSSKIAKRKMDIDELVKNNTQVKPANGKNRVTMLFDDYSENVFNAPTTQPQNSPDSNKMLPPIVESPCEQLTSSNKQQKLQQKPSPLLRSLNCYRPGKRKWFNRLLQSLSKKNNSTTNLRYQTFLSFEDVNILVLRWLGSSLIDYKQKLMERKKSKQRAQYECMLPERGIKFKISIDGNINSSTELIISSRSRFASDAAFVNLNEEIATLLNDRKNFDVTVTPA